LGDTLRRPASERTLLNKQKAISYAAHRALVDLFPFDQSLFDAQMTSLGYDPNDNATDTTTPTGIGNVACTAVLNFRHPDGSNQLGDLAPGAYSDYTGYVPVNAPSTVPVLPSSVSDPNHWQPLQYYDASGHFVTQKFVGAQWFKVIPFAMSSPDEFLSFVELFGPAAYGSAEYQEQAQELINFSANLSDRQKMIAEYWANGPHTETPPGHWCLFAQYVSARDNHSLDDDVKMFFVMTDALFDAGIAAWDAKRQLDSIRPISAICYLFHGQRIQSWGGPGKGTVWMDGSQWIPYQPSTFPTPAFPEYISGHSTFSAAGASILALWTGSDKFGASVTFAPGSSTTEPGTTPSGYVTLGWDTFSAAASQAGISRRYGGIHFKAGDLVGRAVGELVAQQAWVRAQSYLNGY
jgi:membrane-associated phospholipid phosphatase